MCRRFLLLCAILFGFIEASSSLSSPLSTYLNYSYSTTIRANAIDFWWSIDRIRDEITFELHVNTTGWLALGISSGILRLPTHTCTHASPFLSVSSSWWHERSWHRSRMDRSIRTPSLPGSRHHSFDVIRCIWSISDDRIDMPIEPSSQLSTIQHPIGSDCKAERRMDGQRFNSSVHLTHVIRWTIRSKSVLGLYSEWPLTIKTNLLLVWYKHFDLCIRRRGSNCIGWESHNQLSRSSSLYTNPTATIV